MKEDTEQYNPEQYWNNVATEIKNRDDKNVIAGDDEPYYRYKRQKFLSLLSTLPFQNKRVLEIGSGPGGNLVHIKSLSPLIITGVDISEEMVKVAKLLTESLGIAIHKIDGRSLPFEDNTFNIAITSTVLQHVTSETMVEDLISNICRVCANDIFIFERIEKTRKAITSNVGRTVSEYETMFGKHGFRLEKTQFLYVFWSYACCGIIRKVFNKSGRIEGEPQTKISKILQQITLPITKILDKILPVKNDVAMLHFVRK